MAKLKENLPKLREGKPIFLRAVDGALAANTLRAYIYECMADLRFGDMTLPNVSTKEVIYEGHRAIEIIPRVGSAVSMHDLRSSMVPFNPATAAAGAESLTAMAETAASSTTATRAAWLSACIAEAIDMVQLINKNGGIPEFLPSTPEGRALISELRGRA